MSPHPFKDGLPSIVVSETELECLSLLAMKALKRFPDVSRSLLAEMERAEVLPDAAIPQNVVRMGSVVEFKIDVDQKLKLQLVYPGDADISEGKISILSPVGTALIGLAPGQSMRWSGHNGRRHTLDVLDVTGPAAT